MGAAVVVGDAVGRGRLVELLQLRARQTALSSAAAATAVAFTEEAGPAQQAERRQHEAAAAAAAVRTLPRIAVAPWPRWSTIRDWTEPQAHSTGSLSEAANRFCAGTKGGVCSASWGAGERNRRGENRKGCAVRWGAKRPLSAREAFPAVLPRARVGSEAGRKCSAPRRCSASAARP